ncbi:hypothetical protein PGT21_032268 [Puccinia graminis f. sp. tritici]|uniref:Uncharacterized protein n=1 Tax=Puccinia graminis f. sp. tritici TaxID=56615 RepID=A0A5B0N857_PUCGR|nr:hypothetical protein PGT21_032268 [Puccinia graminis f. sp. tritici]KAA1099174.1 hypothetical protein PGTUg99_012959 [Puccinia graminis f. sp. tritici]
MAIKLDPETQPSRVEAGPIDLQRFQLSDGPLFLGPFQDVKRTQDLHNTVWRGKPPHSVAVSHHT